MTKKQSRPKTKITSEPTSPALKGLSHVLKRILDRDMKEYNFVMYGTEDAPTPTETPTSGDRKPTVFDEGDWYPAMPLSEIIKKLGLNSRRALACLSPDQYRIEPVGKKWYRIRLDTLPPTDRKRFEKK